MALDFLLNVSGPELHDAVLRAFLEQALDCLYGEPSIVQLAGVAEGLSEKAGAPRRNDISILADFPSRVPRVRTYARRTYTNTPRQACRCAGGRATTTPTT